jgi:hypothetical protein
LKEAEGNSFHIPRGHLIEDISKIQKRQAGRMDIIQRNQFPCRCRCMFYMETISLGAAKKPKGFCY